MFVQRRRRWANIKPALGGCHPRVWWDATDRALFFVPANESHSFIMFIIIYTDINL